MKQYVRKEGDTGKKTKIKRKAVKKKKKREKIT